MGSLASVVEYEGIAQLCSIEILEYGIEDEFLFHLRSGLMKCLTCGARFDANPGVSPTYSMSYFSVLFRDDNASQVFRWTSLPPHERGLPYARHSLLRFSNPCAKAL